MELDHCQWNSTVEALKLRIHSPDAIMMCLFCCPGVLALENWCL